VVPAKVCFFSHGAIDDGGINEASPRNAIVTLDAWVWPSHSSNAINIILLGWRQPAGGSVICHPSRAPATPPLRPVGIAERVSPLGLPLARRASIARPGRGRPSWPRRAISSCGSVCDNGEISAETMPSSSSQTTASNRSHFERCFGDRLLQGTLLLAQPFSITSQNSLVRIQSDYTTSGEGRSGLAEQSRGRNRELEKEDLRKEDEQ
jgi:hypothetical protein